MKKYKIRATIFAILLFIACLSISFAAAWQVGTAGAYETVYVPVERSEEENDLPPPGTIMPRSTEPEHTVPMEQLNIGRGIAFGAPVFVVGAMLSAALTELYYAALIYFRREDK